MARGRAWRSECQKASAVWPVSVRPERSVIVPEIHDRQALAHSREDFLDRVDGGLGVQRIEDRLDHEEIGAAFDQRARGVG